MNSFSPKWCLPFRFPICNSSTFLICTVPLPNTNAVKFSHPEIISQYKFCSILRTTWWEPAAVPIRSHPFNLRFIITSAARTTVISKCRKLKLLHEFHTHTSLHHCVYNFPTINDRSKRNNINKWNGLATIFLTPQVKIVLVNSKCLLQINVPKKILLVQK